MLQLGPLFGISASAADRVVDHIAPLLALAPVRGQRLVDTVLIVDSTPVPSGDRSVAVYRMNYRSTSTGRSLSPSTSCLA